MTNQAVGILYPSRTLQYEKSRNKNKQTINQSTWEFLNSIQKKHSHQNQPKPNQTKPNQTKPMAATGKE
jgi:hypothetical protein